MRYGIARLQLNIANDESYTAAVMRSKDYNFLLRIRLIYKNITKTSFTGCTSQATQPLHSVQYNSNQFIGKAEMEA